MASTYEPIATTTLGSNQSSVTLSSIPQTYTDLVVIIRAANSNAPTIYGAGITFNSDGKLPGIYSFTQMYGDGTSAASFRWNTSQAYVIPAFSSVTSLNSGDVGIVNIMNYANTTTYKTILSRFGAASLATYASVGLRQSTTAINSITFWPNDGTNTILSGSTFSLYGIKAA